MSENQNKFLNESNSQKEEFHERTVVTFNENYDKNLKIFSNQLFNSIETSLQLFNTHYEKNIDKNKNSYTIFCNNLKNDLKQNKYTCDLKKNTFSITKNKLNNHFKNQREFKIKNKIFLHLRLLTIENKNQKYENNIIVKNYIFKKRIMKIFNIWKNISHINLKKKINSKYFKFLNFEKEKLEQKYKIQINDLIKILHNLENNIKIEIDERKQLSNIYDNEMNKGANKFLQETQMFKDFNSSDIQTP